MVHFLLFSAMFLNLNNFKICRPQLPKFSWAAAVALAERRRKITLYGIDHTAQALGSAIEDMSPSEFIFY